MDIGALTRKIYLKQHKRISKNKSAFDRIYGIYSDQSYGLGDKWFKNKISLDAGCGNFGALTLRLSKLGCKKIYACDLGKKWIKPMKNSLIKRGVKLDNIEFNAGDILKLKYKKNFFDFVAVNGVLPHLRNKKEIQKGFSEGAKVCKKGGYYFTSFGVSGGLIQAVILPAIRNHYKLNKKFRQFIDNISAKEINKILRFIIKVNRKNKGPTINYNFLKNLFGEDFCVFLHNHIQAPYWLTNECSKEFINAMYKKNGFTDIRRIKRFVKRNDIRKFFAPLHFERENQISQLLYGQGYMQFIGKKK